jgi:hypothetical protein
MLIIALLSTFAFSVYTMNVNNAYAQAEPPLTVTPFKGVYSVGMTVTLFGQVTGSFTAGSNVALKVTNPTGQTYQNANAKLDEGGSYTFEFKLEGGQATALGVHSVEATYQSLKATASFEVKEKASLKINADKSKFDLGEIVVLTGTVTPRLLEPVEIKIYNPDNVIWKFFAVSPDKIRTDGTFRAEIGELSGKLSIQGTYKVEASYADDTASASLQFSVAASGKVTPGRFMLVDQSGKQMTEIFVGQQVLVQADVRNNLQEKQPFSYLVLINDADGFTVSLSWITGTLPPSETLSAAQSWIPDNAGRFTVKVFVWKSVAEPEPLGKSLETTVTVTE